MMMMPLYVIQNHIATPVSTISITAWCPLIWPRNHRLAFVFAIYFGILHHTSSIYISCRYSFMCQNQGSVNISLVTVLGLLLSTNNCLDVLENQLLNRVIITLSRDYVVVQWWVVKQRNLLFLECWLFSDRKFKYPTYSTQFHVMSFWNNIAVGEKYASQWVIF